MTIQQDLSTLAPLELVEMYEIDLTAAKLQVPTAYKQIWRWHSGTKPVGMVPIVWNKNTYEAFPIESDGWQTSTLGKLPRPVLRVSNVGGQIGKLLSDCRDALGAKVTRIRTLGKYLDAINFAKGNANANPNAKMPDEIFYIARKQSENPILVEIELASAFDVEGIMLPRRQVLASICPWRYRGPDCTYAGPPVQTIDGVATSDPKQDACNKSLTACKARFGTGILKFGGFPGSLLGTNR